jgi:hypothetical protein
MPVCTASLVAILPNAEKKTSKGMYDLAFKSLTSNLFYQLSLFPFKDCAYRALPPPLMRTLICAVEFAGRIPCLATFAPVHQCYFRPRQPVWYITRRISIPKSNKTSVPIVKPVNFGFVLGLKFHSTETLQLLNKNPTCTSNKTKE